MTAHRRHGRLRHLDLFSCIKRRGQVRRAGIPFGPEGYGMSGIAPRLSPAMRCWLQSATARCVRAPACEQSPGPYARRTTRTSEAHQGAAYRSVAGFRLGRSSPEIVCGTPPFFACRAASKISIWIRAHSLSRNRLSNAACYFRRDRRGKTECRIAYRSVPPSAYAAPLTRGNACSCMAENSSDAKEFRPQKESHKSRSALLGASS